MAVTRLGIWEAFPRHPDQTEGMSFREYLAGQALAGLAGANSPAEEVASRAVALADAVMLALKQPPPEAEGGAP